MAAITLRDVTKRWGDFTGVHAFDLDIADREFVVLLGPSGCGKTTTMRMVAGLENVTEGDIAFDGRRVNALNPKDRDIAMVFQSYGLYPNLTVWENIRFPLRMRKVDPATHDERVQRAVDMVELEGFTHRKPAELSGGQRQRVALARAIVRKPAVFLMDEPLSNLDAKLRVSTRAQIKNLHNELGVTTIYVTHDQIEAMTLADRVVVMRAGRIMQVGTPSEVYGRPANTFVASFIGSPAMNLLEGTLAEGRFTTDGAVVEGLPTGGAGRATLGFRAEDATLVLPNETPPSGPGGIPSGGLVEAPVYAMELLGDSSMVSVRAGGALVAVKAPKDVWLDIATPVGIHVPLSACHLFDGETQERIPFEAVPA